MPAIKAVCVLNNEPVKGTIFFTQEHADSPVKVTGEIQGLEEGKNNLASKKGVM
jgi:Copper/zinc superoxide dismutase (SODC).